MASELGLPPPAKSQPPALTTITDIGDDLLHEIFLRLPSLPSLVRAALAFPAFLHAVRSSTAFRRHFQSLHPPQILGFFIDPGRTAFPRFAPLRSRSNPGLAATVRGSDFFLTRIPQESADSGSGWEIESCHSGYVVLVNHTTDQIAAYNPLMQALDIFPMPPEKTFRFFEFHIVISEGDQGVFRMVGVQHGNTPQQLPACIAVFSSATREWKVLPWVEPPQPEDDEGPPMPPQPDDDDAPPMLPQLEDDGAPPMPRQPEDDGAPPMLPQPEDDGDDMIPFYPSTRLNELVYWKHASQAYALVLNTATLQFSRVELPPMLKVTGCKPFWLGQTKDGKLFMVGTDNSDAYAGTLFVSSKRANDDGVEKWMVAKMFPLGTFIDVTKGDATVQIEAVIDGYVYLSAKYVEQPESSLLSIFLETGKVNKLFDDTHTSPDHPYIMMWPYSLVCNKEDPQTKVTGVRVADVGPVSLEESPSVLDVENSLATKAA